MVSREFIRGMGFTEPNLHTILMNRPKEWRACYVLKPYFIYVVFGGSESLIRDLARDYEIKYFQRQISESPLVLNADILTDTELAEEVFSHIYAQGVDQGSFNESYSRSY